MIEPLGWVVWFIVAVGVLVTVHELGHFAVARWCGVRVLRFSVGFGRPMWLKRGRDDTEYVIAAIPLGGYVKMLDEREGPVDAAERDRAFNTQSVGKRIAIVAAGPAANFAFAVLAFAMMYLAGITDLRPVVGEPSGLAAAAGFESGDLIEAVDDRPVLTWSEAALGLLEGVMERRSMTITVRGMDGDVRQYTLDPERSEQEIAEDRLLQDLGFRRWSPEVPPVISIVSEGSAAERAGVQPGDRILAVEGETIDSWSRWHDVIRAHPEELIEVTVLRDAQQLELTVIPDRRESEEGPIGFLGVSGRLPEEALDRLYVTQRYGPITALGMGASETVRISALTLSMIGRMLMGQASIKNLSGPISIARYANDTAAAGLSSFLRFLAVLSVSLGILNILPIPVLDGGHLMYYLIELVKGSPVSEQVQFMGQRIGIGLLLGLMLLVFYHDILRLFPA